MTDVEDVEKDRAWKNGRVAFLSAKPRASQTRDPYESRLRLFEEWCETLGYQPLDIDAAQLFEYRRHVSSSHKLSTVNLEMSVLKQLYRFLARRRIITENPGDEIAWETIDAEWRDVPDVTELRSLWDACIDDDERAVVGLLGLCGLKSSELQDAQVRDLGSVDGVDLLRVPARRKPHQTPYVALCEPLATVLARLKEARQSGPLVRSRWDNGLDRHSLRKLTRRIGARAKLTYLLSPQQLGSALRSVAIERGYGYGEIVRSIGEIEARRLAKWVDRVPGSVDDHPALRLGRLVLGSGSESGDSLHLASEILRSTDSHPAATTAYAGVIVERHLRRLMHQNELPLPKSPKLSAYGAALKQVDAIDNRALQLLNRMQDLRNAAAHGRFEDIDETDATWFRDNARSLFKSFPVAEIRELSDGNEQV